MTLRPYSLAQADETRPGELRALDPDEPTRAEAVKRLIELADAEPREIYNFQAWRDRLAALWLATPTWWRWRRWHE